MTQKHLVPRAERIEMVAAIAVGRHREDPARAAPGWQTRLSTAMGLSHGAVHAAIKAGGGRVFDRKMRTYIATLREQMVRDLATLEGLERTFAASEGTVLPHDDAGVVTTTIETTAKILAPEAHRLEGWKVRIMLAFPGDRTGGGVTMLQKDLTTIFVHDQDITVNHEGEPLTLGVATIAEAFALIDAADAKTGEKQ